MGCGILERVSFDRALSTIAIGDVGNRRYEEIDCVPVPKSRGANFGWSAYEAFAPFKGGIPRRDTVLPAYRLPPRAGMRGRGRLHRP